MDKTPRTQTTRETTARPKLTFRPPALLPEPDQEDGYKYRWIRTATLGKADPLNVSTRRREGWEPVKAADHPELAMYVDKAPSGNVEIGGLMLAKASNEMIEARDEYYNNLATRQIESVDNNYMRESDPRMPLLKPQRKSRTTFGTSNEDS